jgi:class 3 adenylate cyclase/tetratricopeptide (TPR) repeat protein
MLTTTDKRDRLQQALAELERNRAHFSEASYTAMTQLLQRELEQLDVPDVKPDTLPTRIDEMRLVTVMFVDIVDSTTMVEKLEENGHDTADWKHIIDEAHRRIAEIVNRWDGQVGQYLGDGVLCFFGAQHSRGEEATYAVSSALAIRQTIAQYARIIASRYKINFEIRIGISTGRVVVGMIGSGEIKQELLALGPATNLAARLQSLAQPNTVLIDAPTQNRVRRQFNLRAHSADDLKGFAEQVAYYEVLDRQLEVTTQFAETSINGIKVPLVGREEDIAYLNYLVNRAVDDEVFQSVTVIGDVGIGKSRLLQEMAQRADEDFHCVLMQASYEQRNRGYNIFYDWLLRHCRITDEMPYGEAIVRIEDCLAQIAPVHASDVTAHALGSLAGLPQFPAAQMTMLDDLLDWFEQLSQQRPLFISVDNLQWVDQRSVIFLERLVRRLEREIGVLLVGARPEYRRKHAGYMQSYAYHPPAELDVLTTEATRDLIEAVLEHVERIPSHIDVAGILTQRAEGNPLFAQEFLAHLFDQEVFVQQADTTWRFNLKRSNSIDDTLPNGLVSILQARLDDLPSPARQIIQIASICGQTFWDDAVMTLSKSRRTHDLLAMLVTSGMIIQENLSAFRANKQYTFRYSLYRDVAYKMLPRQQRIAYHTQMSNWLLQYIAGKTRYYALLADQFNASEQYGAALYTYLEAVEDSLKREFYSDALRLIDISLAIAREVPRDEALPVTSKLWAYQGQALFVLGRYDEASAASQTSLRLLGEMPDNALTNIQIMSEQTLGSSYSSLGNYNHAFDALTRAYNLLHHSASGLISAVLRAFGELLMRRGRLNDSLAYHRRSLSQAQKSGDQNLIARALAQLGTVDIERGYLADALETFEQTQNINQQKKLPYAETQDLRYMGTIYLALLQSERAYACFDQALAIDTGVEQHNVLLLAYRGLAWLNTGHIEGWEQVEAAFQQGHRDLYVMQLLHLVHMDALALLQEYQACEAAARTFLRDVVDENELMRARGLRWLGYAQYHLQAPNALDTLLEALELEQYHGGRDVWLCHFAIAEYHDDGSQWQGYHYRQAAKMLQQRADALQARPNVHRDFLAHPIVQRILRKVVRTD